MKSKTRTRIIPPGDSWPGKMSASSETQNILVGRSVAKCLLFPKGRNWLQIRKCFCPAGRSLPRLPTKLTTGTRIGSSGDFWTGKMSFGCNTKKYLVAIGLIELAGFWSELRKKYFSSRVRSLSRLPTKLSTGTQIGPSGDSWIGKVSVGLDTKNIFVAA